MAMETSHYWESDSRSAVQEIYSLLKNPSVCYRIHKTQSHFWAKRIQTIALSNIQFNIILPSVLGSSM
jgi:hypothetical protein